MGRSEAEDALGLSPVKDDNEAAVHFNRRTLPFFKCVDYISKCNKAWRKKIRRWTCREILDRL